MKKNKLTKKIYIIGAGKLGILASEIIKRQGKFRIIGFVESDNRKIGKLINNIKVFSDGDVFKKNKPSNINLVIAIGDINKRKKLIKYYTKIKNINFPNIIDPDSHIIYSETKLGKGCIISVNATILNNCNLGDFCIVGTSTSILHDTTIGNNCLIGGQTVIGANAKINNDVFIGVGATIPSSSIKIGSTSFICSGSVILRNVGKNSKMLGNPAKKVI
mgnify:CR=1 FL=1